MKKISKILSLLAFTALPSMSQAQLPSDFLFNPPLEDICIYDFSGVSAADNPDNDVFTYDIDLTHNPFTGAVSGTGSFVVVDWAPDSGVSVDLNGSATFSAKVAKAGNVIRLLNARIGVTGTGEAQVRDEGTYIVNRATTTLMFSSLSMNTDAGLTVSGAVRNGSLRAQVTNPSGRKSSTSAKISAFNTEFSFPADNKVGVIAQFDITTDGRGRIAGSADVEIGDTSLGTWSIRGNRNSRSGISTITAKGNRGLSASLFFNDAGELVGSKNTATLLGYTFRGF